MVRSLQQANSLRGSERYRGIGSTVRSLIDAAVSGMIEDELSSKSDPQQTVAATAHDASRAKGGKCPATRFLYVFHDPTLGLELPPLGIPSQITPPTPEERVWADRRGEGDWAASVTRWPIQGAFTGVHDEARLSAFRFYDVEWFGNEVNVRHAISKRRGTDGAHKWEWHVEAAEVSEIVTPHRAATESVMSDAGAGI